MNTQDERVALWNAAKEMIKTDSDKVPDGMCIEVFGLLKEIYNSPDSWVDDSGPGGRGLSWSMTVYVDNLLKDPMLENNGSRYR